MKIACLANVDAIAIPVPGMRPNRDTLHDLWRFMKIEATPCTTIKQREYLHAPITIHYSKKKKRLMEYNFNCSQIWVKADSHFIKHLASKTQSLYQFGAIGWSKPQYRPYSNWLIQSTTYLLQEYVLIIFCNDCSVPKL